MRPYPAPFDAIVAGHSAPINLHGQQLLASRHLNKGRGFTRAERRHFGLRGLLADSVVNIKEQVESVLTRLERLGDPLHQYAQLADIQDRNTTLFYRLINDHLSTLLPILYTPTVGAVCEDFSSALRRPRGLWIGPRDIRAIPTVLRNLNRADVRVIVVTDGERVLGLGDQGAGGMAIVAGKATLYAATGGIHPSVVLPVMLDVGTDNPRLLGDPRYVGHSAPRLRGEAYDIFLEEFVVAVKRTWPSALVHWEDFKQYNAMRILDRYRNQVASFNDDVQGTAATVLGGLFVHAAHTGRPLAAERVLIVGAGAAGIGIARLLRRAIDREARSAESYHRQLLMVDSQGIVHTGRSNIDDSKLEFAISGPAAHALALPRPGGLPPALSTIIRNFRPTILIGISGVRGIFSRDVIRALAEVVSEPVVFALSNPASVAEATPDDVLAWSDGRAIIATGSPFEPVTIGGRELEIAQANNVFIFPGLGLGAMVAEAAAVTDSMLVAAAEALAACVGTTRAASGMLFPPIAELRRVSRAVAIAVARAAHDAGVARGAPGDLDAQVDAALWFPSYVPYRRS